MSYDYEASIWGRGEATLAKTDPTSFRLKTSLSTIKDISSGRSVLEVGCGAGQFIRAIHRIRPDLLCFGSDISREAITSARNTNDGVVYSEQDPNRLPFEDGKFSAVLVYDVLEHVDNPSVILSEAFRVLGKGGVLYAFVPCEGDRLSMWNLLRKLKIGMDLTKKHAGHIQYFSRRSLMETVKNCGFQIVHTYYSEHFLGQLIGILAFFGMDRAVKQSGVRQINNETYFQKNQNNAIISALKRLVNAGVYFESELFRRLPSPNIHIFARKP